MALLVDYQIERLIQRGMIENPCDEKPSGLPLAAGLLSSGYVARLAKDAFLADGDGELVDPASDFHCLPTRKLPVWEKKSAWHKLGTHRRLIIEPQSFVQARTVEVLRLPDDVTAVCHGIPDYARCGLHIPTVVLEPGWQGPVQLNIFNHCNNRVRLYVERGICTLQFHTIERPNRIYAETRPHDVGRSEVLLGSGVFAR